MHLQSQLSQRIADSASGRSMTRLSGKIGQRKPHVVSPLLHVFDFCLHPRLPPIELGDAGFDVNTASLVRDEDALNRARYDF